MPASDVAERLTRRPSRSARIALRRSTGLSLLGALPLVATGIVYLPLTRGYFVSDDFLNLYSIINADRLEYLLTPHGGHLLVTRNALFILFHFLFGVRAELYFAAVLATHLLNVVLLQRAILHWTDSPPLAALGATMWGTCPVQTGTLEWYSVYGQVVVGTILLVILDTASRLWQSGEPPVRSAIVVWPLLLVVASTCFGVGIGLTIVAPVAFFLLLPRSRRRWQLCLALLALALAVPSGYRALITEYDQLSGSVKGIVGLSITLGGLSYPQQILQMAGELLSCGIAAVVLGFAAVPVQFPNWPSVLAIVCFAGAFLATLGVAPGRVRRVAVGLLLLAVACYAMIALGRALYAQSIAEAAGRTRYHYVATIPLVALLCLMINQLTSRVRRRAALHGLILLTWMGGALWFYAQAEPFIDLHAAARRETAEVLENLHQAIASAAPGQEVRIRNRPFRSIGTLLFNQPSGFPGWAGVYTIFFPENVVDGRPVRFVVSDPDIADAAANGRRTHDLFVLDGAAPSPPPAPAPAMF
jgi:hypothetical protein